MGFEGRVVLITGAAAGIGEDVAISFAKLGARVSLVDLNGSELNRVVEKIKSVTSAIPLAIVADVTKDAPKIIEQTIQHFGELDILVNNAGIFRRNFPPDMDLEIYDEIFAINCRALVEVTKLATPHLEKTKGNIVNVSSIGGLQAYGKAAYYCMSKAAVTMYTKCTALDLAPKGIRVNSVEPGVIRTPLYENLGLDEQVLKAFLAAEQEKYPVGRLGEVSDTTNAILFLASEKSSFINGVSLSVDGGRLIA